MLAVITAIALCMIPASTGMASTEDACGEWTVMHHRIATQMADRPIQSQRGLEAQSPQPPATSLVDKLAGTGGVLAPPDGGSLIIIEPPDTGLNSMETKPDITPRADSAARAFL